MNDATTRQMMGCGYEPQMPDHVVPPSVWMPPMGAAGFGFGECSEAEPLGERAPHWCPGYTTRLPEVIEAARARLHWSKGQLDTFLGGEAPTEQLIVGIEIIEGEANAMQQWSMTPTEKGGGWERG